MVRTDVVLEIEEEEAMPREEICAVMGFAAEHYVNGDEEVPEGRRGVEGRVGRTLGHEGAHDGAPATEFEWSEIAEVLSDAAIRKGR